MSNVPPKTKSRDLNGMNAGRLLAKAPKTVVIAAVVLADLLINGGLLVSRTYSQSAVAPTNGLSCERSSCQRPSEAKPALAVAVDIPTGKPRLLEFTSKHCASCSRMAPLVFKLERECTAHDGTILPVDVETDTGDELASRYAVHELPTFIMVDEKGSEVTRLVGEQPRERLKIALADVNGVLCTVL